VVVEREKSKTRIWYQTNTKATWKGVTNLNPPETRIVLGRGDHKNLSRSWSNDQSDVMQFLRYYKLLMRHCTNRRANLQTLLALWRESMNAIENQLQYEIWHIEGKCRGNVDMPFRGYSNLDNLDFVCAVQESLDVRNDHFLRISDILRLRFRNVSPNQINYNDKCIVYRQTCIISFRVRILFFRVQQSFSEFVLFRSAFP
jgi:hypothetical protein